MTVGYRQPKSRTARSLTDGGVYQPRVDEPARSFVDWRRSLADALDMDSLVCDGCGTPLDAPAHSPRCRA